MSIESNGHVWEVVQPRIVRTRDIRFWRCTKCGRQVRTSLRSTHSEESQALAKEPTCASVSMGCTVPYKPCPLCPSDAKTCTHL